jgi:ABC-type multidrug transport system fused ATPase/permease subunit
VSVPRTAQPPPKPAGYGAFLLIYLRPQRGRVALLFALLLGGIGLQLVNPQILSRFIDLAVGGVTITALTITALLFLAAAIVGQVVTIVETYVAEGVGWTATNHLRADLALHCLRLDAAFHSRHTPGELLERIDGDVAKLGNFFSRFVVAMLGNFFLMLGVLIILYSVDWRVGAAMTVYVLVAAAAVISLRDVAVPGWAAARAASADLFGFLEERLAGTEDLRTSGTTAIAHAQAGLAARSDALLRLQRRAGLLGNTISGTMIILFAVGTALSLGLGTYLYRGGMITIGTVYLLFSYTEMLRRPIEQITRQLSDLQQAAAGIGRVRALLAERSAIIDGPGIGLNRAKAAAISSAPTIEFDHVTFTYPADPEVDHRSGEVRADGPALENLSFTIPAGARLGLLGRTGSGKTTIARLLARLYDPQEGSVRLGGHDLREARIAELRAQIGVVTQEIQLFHATVRDNLTFFDRTITDTAVLGALDTLGLGDWCRALPEGLDTILPLGGGGLSAGEAQLLAFVRVFLRDPGLIILDEASSRLDPATEVRVERAVDRLLTGRTGIIIAHRLATVERADTILLLERGRILETGPRAALAADPDSRFAHLLRVGLAETLV